MISSREYLKKFLNWLQSLLNVGTTKHPAFDIYNLPTCAMFVAINDPEKSAYHKTERNERIYFKAFFPWQHFILRGWKNQGKCVTFLSILNDYTYTFFSLLCLYFGNSIIISNSSSNKTIHVIKFPTKNNVLKKVELKSPFIYISLSINI